MTTLHHAYGAPVTRVRPPVPTRSVFGVEWPLYKLHALAAAALAVAVVVIAGGSGVTAMWVSAVVLLGIWWGESRCVVRDFRSFRWDDGGRDHHASREQHDRH
ncbi:MAG: hypothetical protein QM809_11835 [Gordonia sp. (in: high G+C Gram-positive bacteria)]|uniref:hypothetical protein n=1 Tax=Gordonia sp. (in: high G+C Gram-positive bacteria) TaxID=84139 RepID=UPI0039E32C4A